MTIREDLEYLDQLQTDAEALGEEAEASTGVPRREFVFLSLVSAAATTFGFGARAVAQAQCRAWSSSGGDRCTAAPGRRSFRR